MSAEKGYTVADYCDVIVRGILSGNNSCGTLKDAVSTGDKKYFAKCAEGVVRTLVQERDAARAQMYSGSTVGNDLRRVLEFVAQNLGGAVQISDPSIVAELEKALGRKL